MRHSTRLVQRARRAEGQHLLVHVVELDETGPLQRLRLEQGHTELRLAGKNRSDKTNTRTNESKTERAAMSKCRSTQPAHRPEMTLHSVRAVTDSSVVDLHRSEVK